LRISGARLANSERSARVAVNTMEALRNEAVVNALDLCDCAKVSPRSSSERSSADNAQIGDPPDACVPRLSKVMPVAPISIIRRRNENNMYGERQTLAVQTKST
jgi:hypothetical protein